MKKQIFLILLSFPLYVGIYPMAVEGFKKNEAII